MKLSLASSGHPTSLPGAPYPPCMKHVFDSRAVLLCCLFRTIHFFNCFSGGASGSGEGSVLEVLTWGIDLAAPVKPAFCRGLANFAKDPLEKSALLALSLKLHSSVSTN